MWQQVEPLLHSRFSNLETRHTTARGDAEGFAAEFARSHPAGSLVVVGGDGSIHETVNGLLDAEHQGSLSIVPAGTGNDIARNLGVSGDPLRAAGFDPARIRQVDVGRVSFGRDQADHRWFLNSLSVGTSARANRIAHSLGRAIRSPAKYPVAGVLALLSSGAHRYEILVDGQRQFQGNAINLTVANGECFGGGLRISPGSSQDDGALDLVIIGDLARARALRALRALRDGTHVTMRDVQVLSAIAAPIEIHAPGRMPFETDGENLVSHDRVIVNLVPGRLKVAR